MCISTTNRIKRNTISDNQPNMYTAGVVEFSQSNGVPYTSVPNLQNKCSETIVRIASPCVILISFLVSSIFFSFLYLVFYNNFTNTHFSNLLKQYSCHKNHANCTYGSYNKYTKVICIF